MSAEVWRQLIGQPPPGMHPDGFDAFALSMGESTLIRRAKEAIERNENVMAAVRELFQWLGEEPLTKDGLAVLLAWMAVQMVDLQEAVEELERK